MSAVECQIHFVMEISDENTYRECGECWHVFQTKDDLQREHDRLVAELDLTPADADDVYVCPFCAHDF